MATAPFCALPPIRGTARIGRGFGVGYNRSRSASNQLHAGQDFVAAQGTPVFAPLPGRVVFVSRNEGPMITSDQAASGAMGQVRGMAGYGNSVVIQHDFAFAPPTTPLPTNTTPPRAGLPNPFWTSYNHLSAVLVRPGQILRTGDLIGNVGNTTNGQFAGMGAHLHFEVRVRPFPGSYQHDTVDPNLLWSSLGITNVGARREVQRTVGGELLVNAGGPSDCQAGQASRLTLAGLDAGYVGAASLATKYAPAPSVSGSGSDEEPPDYAPLLEQQKLALLAEGKNISTKIPSPKVASGSNLVVVGGAAVVAALFFGFGRR